VATSLEALLASGELQRVAAECSTQQELAKRIGITPDQYIDRARGIRKRGRYFPSFADLKAPTLGVDMAAATERVRAKQDEWRNSGAQAPIAPHRESDTTTEAPIVSSCGDFPVQESAAKQENRFPSLAAFDDPPLPAISQGYRVKGVSTLVDADGETKAQWIKTTREDDGRKDWLEAIREMCAGVPPIEPIAWTTPSDADLLSVYPVGDPHVGLKAWHEDSGENFDLKIAERNLVAAFEKLIEVAPPSHEALIVFIGDNTHSDGQSNTTTKGTRVDVDDRTIKMMRTVVSVARRAIDLALGKHARVTMIVERGNHDELLSAMLALALGLLYENEPRVTIDQSPEMFHWFRFGANLIGTHHGDKAKPMDLLGVMAVDRQRDWGETTHRRFYCGHLHHQITKEVPGVVIDYLPTLAASDAWHRAMGYRSSRAMYMDVFDRLDGHVDRHIIGIGAVTRHAKASAA